MVGQPYKDSQDKDSVKTHSTNSTASGTDDDVAHNKVAFDRSTTDPQKEKHQAGQGKKVNPLEVSPANPTTSKPRGNNNKAG